MSERLENSSLSSIPDLSPLALHREGDHLRFAIRPQDEIMAQLPEDYEDILADRLSELLADEGGWTVELDLRDVPGLSSRQLGSLIALGKVLRPRFGAIPVTHVSPPVRHLLELTRTDQLFRMG
jgi:anti-anti-sigma regulatory factor